MPAGANAELPPALADWSQSLAGLNVAISAALGPILLRLDELVGRQGGVQGPDGDPDGFDGLTRRGSPERLLIGEWLLADEIPDEFLRRAAEGELLHLAPGFRHEPPHGVVRVLVDAGPDQLGVGRLVQFAALIVLHRRALRLGAVLQVGVLGARPGHWLTGELPELLRVWLLSRRAERPGWDDVRAWTDSVPSAGEGPDEAALWLFCAPQLLSGLPSGERPPVPRRRILTSRESGWDGDGARTVEVGLAGERLTLSLPSGPEAVRALRGQGFRRDAAIAREIEPDDDRICMRHPMFPAGVRRLVGRGADRHELVWIRVPDTRATTQRRPKRRRFDETVMGVGVVGSRLVVLLAHGEMAEVRLIGKSLGRFDGLTVPLIDLGLDPELSRLDSDGPLAPILYDSGTLLVRLPEGWYRFARTGEVARAWTIDAAIATDVVDRPQIVVHRPGSMPAPVQTLDAVPTPQRTRLLRGVPAEASIRLGHDWMAWSVDGIGWQLRRRDAVHPVTVAVGAQVLGVVEVNAVPGLITVSSTGLVLRLVQPEATRTLTAWSRGDPRIAAAVHPTLPLIAVVTADGAVEVADLVSECTLQRVAAPT